MLVDAFENLPYYSSLFPHLQTILEFLKQNPLHRLPIGRHNILKDDVYVNIDVYNTQPDKLIEAHRTYIDLQMLIEGTEQIGDSECLSLYFLCRRICTKTAGWL